MNRSISTAIAVMAMLGAGLTYAQAVTCSASDLPCISGQYELACRVDEATHQSCTDWTRELEASRLGDTENGRLIAAAAYIALSEMSEGEEEAVRQRDRAWRTYTDLVSENPANVDALVGLAGLVDTHEERVELLLRVVDVAPSNVRAWEWLATLASVNNEPEGFIRSAQYREQAYSVAAGERRWTIAANVVHSYELAGAPNQASEFIRTVRTDFALERKRERFEDVSQLPSRVRQETLQQVCSNSAVVLFGPSPCLEAIGSVVSFVDDAPVTPFAIEAAEHAAEAMLLAATSGWRIAVQAPLWHDTMLSWMEQLVSSDKVTAMIYVAQARLAPTDGEQRLLAMRNAANLAPEDGDIAFGLALAYYDLARWHEAVDALQRAKSLLPESRHEAVDEFLGQALDAVAAGSLR